MARKWFGARTLIFRLITSVVAGTLLVTLAGCGSSNGPPVQSPSPRGAYTAPTEVGLRLGFSAGELVGLSPPELSAALDEYTAAGGSMIRFDIDWARVQPDGPGAWDWSAIDPVVDALAARHLTALAILDYTPAWARPSGCTSQLCGPADPAEFATFAAAAATRYAGRGVHLWEVWNEQNTTWLPTPDPDAYGRLLRLSSAALHGIDPAATVLVGGLAPAGTASDHAVAPSDFVSALYTLGLRSAFDGVAVHPYSFPSLPGEPLAGSGWQQMLEVRNVMAGNHDAAKGIWATEFGAPTAGPGAIATFADRRYASRPDHVDLDLQARTVSQGVALGRGYPWLRVLLWYGIRDFSADPQAGLMSFGLRYLGGSPKPSYAAWQAAVRSLSG